MNVQLTERDINLLHWINGLGFIDIEHAKTKLNIDKSTAYKRLKKLVDNNYLIYEKIFFNSPGVYRLSKKGFQSSNDDLSPLARINIAKYNHDITVAKVALFLTNKYSEKSFISERRIRRFRSQNNFNEKGHICAGCITIGNQKIALEIELSGKSRHRREAIIKYYTRAFEYDQIWYIYATDAIKKQILPLISRRKFIKLVPLESLIHIK